MTVRLTLMATIRGLATRTILLAFLPVWFLSVGYVGINLNRGWVPHDEGILAQSAERVLHGELPHRDFNEPYTGGLAYMDAAAFRFFGVNLMVLRWVLFAFFLLWVPAVFAIAREFCAHWPAAGVTLLSVAWSVPNYPAAMPSWFCLFLATFGVLFLFRYLRSPHPAWLLLAGLCGGLSFLIKSPGLFYIAGVLLFLVFREQSLSREIVGTQTPPRRTVFYVTFLAVCLFAFVTVLVRMVMPRGGTPEFLHLVFPAFAICGLLLTRERFYAFRGNRSRFKQLFALTFPFLAGALLPVLVFFVFYFHRSSVSQLFYGLFVTQLRRLVDARMSPPHWIFELGAIGLALVLFSKVDFGRSPSIVIGWKVVAGSLLLLFSHKSLLVFLLVLNSVRALLPLFAAAAVALLIWRHRNFAVGLPDQRLMLLLSVAVMCSLVQFPYAGPLYFCYFATLFFLAFFSWRSLLPSGFTFDLVTPAVFLAVFAVAVLRPLSLAAFEFQRLPAQPNSALLLPRATGLRVFQDQAALYDELIPFLKRQSAGQPIFAGPDCPEIYFLADLQNQTPFFFDFFAQPLEYTAHLQRLLDRPGFIKVAVVNNDPAFSLPHRDILRALIVTRFPESRKFAHFEVFWRP
jgi:Dolichyl-phosphate-mannose-protein mannosyltransferase